MDLNHKHCVSCERGSPPLSTKEEDEIIKEIPNWQLSRLNIHKLNRQFKFKNFREAMEFVNKTAEIANGENHHPDIHIFYNKVSLDLFTHAVAGLSENDFILAAKINAIA